MPGVTCATLAAVLRRARPARSAALEGNPPRHRGGSAGRGFVRSSLAAAACALLAAGLRAQNPPVQGPPPPPPEPQVEAKTPDKQQPTVVAIKVEGRKRYTEQQLLDALGQKTGEPLDRDAVDKGIALLWKVFSVKADVQYHDVPGGV